jgi:hypothetical protein
MAKKRSPSTTVPATANQRRASKAHSPSPTAYAKLLTEIKARIQQSQTRAVFSVNAELICLY